MKKKLKLKKGVLNILKIFGLLVVVVVVAWFVYNNQLNSIKKLGYSREASKNILFSGNKEYVLSVGENKTLNAAFESPEYNEKYLNNYTKIKYVEHNHLIKNINTLLDKGYSNSDISIILTHGSDSDVGAFAKRERVKYLEEFYSYPYAKIKYYDRYLKYTDETGEDEETTIIHVNLNMDKEAYVDYTEVDKFSTDMLVNKYHKLSDDFEPDELVEIPLEYAAEKGMYANREAYNALVQMFKSAELDGRKLFVNSSYRSYDDQKEIIDLYQKTYGDNYVNKYVAKLGFSEHQTGLAFDLGSKDSLTFASSEEYKWMLENAYKYGFILRFSKKGESITLFRNEPWHYRYVGKEIAKYIHEHGITFEEYYVMVLDK